MNPHIFREYDIRGLVDKDLTEETARLIGLSYGTELQRRGGGTAVVGRDVRLSSPALAAALIEGISGTGCGVLDAGVVPTPVLYFSILNYGGDGGVMVTGSHNPVEYNGFKLSVGAASMFGDEIRRVREIIEEESFFSGSGKVGKISPVKKYTDYIAERISLGRKLKVAVDAGNGTAGEIAPELFRRLGCEVIELYCDPDGSFPNHLPDPTVPELMNDLMEKVKEAGSDLGIGFDGDADRLGAVDEKGNIVWGDRLLGLFAAEILKEGNRKIIFDVKCSQALVEFIESSGGTPVMWKTGHSLIKKKMKDENAPLAGEMSGHMFFADDYYGYDDAIYASCRLLELLSKKDFTLSALDAGIPRYVSTPEIRVDVPDEDKFKIVEEAGKYFRENHKTIDVDGVRILFPEGWGLIRASNTQPVIVLRFEARTGEGLDGIRNTVLSKLKELGVSA
jgi:phosphomannomutase / phosphoglucomutase